MAKILRTFKYRSNVVTKKDKFGFSRSTYRTNVMLQQLVGRPETQNFDRALYGQRTMKSAFIAIILFAKTTRVYDSKANTCKIILIDDRDLASIMIIYNVSVAIENTY